MQKRIRELRLSIELTQAELATVLGVNQSAVGKYERGELEPNIETLKKLSNIFDCSIDFILNNSDDFGNVVSTAQAQTYSADVQELVDIYDSLDEMHRVQVLEYARYFAERTQNTKRKNF